MNHKSCSLESIAYNINFLQVRTVALSTSAEDKLDTK